MEPIAPPDSWPPSLAASHEDDDKGDEDAGVALVLAAKEGDLAFVRNAVGAGVALEATDAEGTTALIAACFSASADATVVARFLLERGANVDAVQGLHSWTAAIAAAYVGAPATLALLLARRPQTLRLVDRYGQSALGYALLHAEECRDADGSAPLASEEPLEVRRERFEECVRLLRSAINLESSTRAAQARDASTPSSLHDEERAALRSWSLFFCFFFLWSLW